jgi:hypothetical protein
MWDFVMDKSGAGAGFLRELRFPLSIYIPSASPQSSSLSPWHNRPGVAAVPIASQTRITFGEHPRKPTIHNVWFQQWNTGEVLWWYDISWYSILFVSLLPFMAEFLQGITWPGWVIWCIPWSRRYFRTTMKFSKTTMAPIYTAGTVRSWFEEHECEIQHLPWPAQSSDLNITGPLWSVLETGVRNRFPPPTSLKQLEDAPQEEWYKNSARGRSKLVRVHSKNDHGCIEGKRWSDTVLMKRCVQYRLCFSNSRRYKGMQFINSPISS